MHSYEQDIVAWANGQARLLRARRFDALDIEHLAEEIEDVGKSEQRELANRMAVLLAHLLKWKHQPQRRGSSWQCTIKERRRSVARRLRKTPSLQSDLQDPEWWEDVWGDATGAVWTKAGVEDLPEICPWTAAKVMDESFWPD